MSAAAEDDWETAEITAPVPKASLRPTAVSFQPRPSSGPSSSGGPSNSQASSSRAPVLLQRPVQVPPVARDARDEGDDWFRGSKPMSNRQIWDSANTRTSAPAVQIISPQPLPQPKVQLLRRPASSSPSGSGPEGGQKGPNRVKTLEEREEEYRLARERIFGPSQDEPGPSVAGGGSASAGASASASRSSSGRGSPRAGGPSSSSVAQSAPATPSGPTTWEGLVPTQVRGPSSRTSSGNAGSAGGLKAGVSANGGAVVRQPLGPGGGAGFGGGGGAGGPGPGAGIGPGYGQSR
ncbi:hypothetical protein IAU60_005854 [Kwoniella sp. DSM 27419]